eukprot:Plantae.Rhodophyta-Purpureofilum_apyrenoidigerum.ctg6869.p1 GENE.Plantae.Rhodophyta-Purpureofilum_apyrenoidigerum.ctg6869~~Plantae.Rhodophyta-Purpureofilum_apyrenoidigerum.ctg6869.p1  ORF type:complete len:294 (+),score=67.76 Plantae.Rhodophyta-Purpureofilum_apyrenoidigerum.ctg6869:70-882(+)
MVKQDPITKQSDYAKEFGLTLIMGSTGGLGTAICKALVEGGCDVYATCRKVKPELEELNPKKIIDKVDMMDDEGPKRFVDELGDVKFDTIIVVAGYFTTEEFGKSNLDEQRKMFEICAIGPMRYVEGLYNGGKLKKGTRIATITSEGGSIGLRTEKEGGGNYGHHGSKAAQNMIFKMLSYDLKPMGASVVMIHPGFLRTKMTDDKFGDKYDELGAVKPPEAVPYILDCITRLNIDNTGRFVAAMGAQGLGLGSYALDDPDSLKPGDSLPW